MQLDQRVKERKGPERTLLQLSPKNYETEKMERHLNKVCSPDRTSAARSYMKYSCRKSWFVFCRPSSSVCRSSEEKWAWKHPALHLQEHSGSKSSLTDETGEAVQKKKENRYSNSAQQFKMFVVCINLCKCACYMCIILYYVETCTLPD